MARSSFNLTSDLEVNIFKFISYWPKEKIMSFLLVFCLWLDLLVILVIWCYFTLWSTLIFLAIRTCHYALFWLPVNRYLRVCYYVLKLVHGNRLISNDSPTIIFYYHVLVGILRKIGLSWINTLWKWSEKWTKNIWKVDQYSLFIMNLCLFLFCQIYFFVIFKLYPNN